MHIFINIPNVLSAKIIILGTQMSHGDVLNILKHIFNSATTWSAIKNFTFWLITQHFCIVGSLVDDADSQLCL